MKYILPLSISLFLAWAGPAMATQATSASPGATSPGLDFAKGASSKHGQLPGGHRDPFNHTAAAAVKPDYDRARISLMLQGVIWAGNQQRALFKIGGEAENGSEVLHTMQPGQTLKVVVGRREYPFTVSRIRQRSVELTSDNTKTYIVDL